MPEPFRLDPQNLQEQHLANPKRQIAAALMMLLVTVTMDGSLPGHGVTSVFQPSAGVALALALHSRMALLPGIAIGLLLAGVLEGMAPVHTLALALGTVVAARVAGYCLLNRPGFDLVSLRLTAVRHLLLFGCIAGAGAGAVAGSAVLWAADGGVSHDGAIAHFAQAWMRQALGILLVTPMLLSFVNSLRQPLPLRRAREAVLLWLLTMGASCLIFGPPLHPALAPLRNAYWMFLFVGWSGMRMGLFSTAALLYLISLSALWGASQSIGFFADDMNASWGVGYWSYMMILGVEGLVLVSYVTDRRKQKTQLSIAAKAFDIHVPLLVTDRDARILRANSAFVALTGHCVQDVWGQWPTSFLTDSLDNPPLSWFRATTSVEQRMQLLRAGGDEVAVWCNVSPVVQKSGDISHYVIAFADVTNFDAEHARLRRAEQAQRDALVREVHHRIKNNLQGVVGMLRSLAQQQPESAMAINHMAGQVQHIATVHGLQNQQSNEAITLVDLLQALVQEVAKTWNIPITFDTPAIPCSARLSPTEAVPMALVLHELIVNAVKHRRGSVHPVDVLVAEDPGDAVVAITITNEGDWHGGDMRTELPSISGHGLELVRLLLPRYGARLSHSMHETQVRTKLVLNPPVIHRVE